MAAIAKPAPAAAATTNPAPPQAKQPIKLFGDPVKKVQATKPDGTKVILCFKALKLADGKVVERPVKPVKLPDGTVKYQLLPPKKAAAPGTATGSTKTPPAVSKPASNTAGTVKATSAPGVKAAAPQTKPAAVKAAAVSAPAQKTAAPTAAPKSAVNAAPRSTTRAAPASAGSRDAANLFGPAQGHGAPAPAATAQKKSFMSRLADNMEGTFKIIDTLNQREAKAAAPAAKPATSRSGARSTPAAKPAVQPAPNAVPQAGAARGLNVARPGQANVATRDIGAKPANYAVVNETIVYDDTDVTTWTTTEVVTEDVVYDEEGNIAYYEESDVMTENIIYDESGNVVYLEETDVYIDGTDVDEDGLNPEELEDAIEGAEDYEDGDFDLEYHQYQQDGVTYTEVAEVDYEGEGQGGEDVVDVEGHGTYDIQGAETLAEDEYEVEAVVDDQDQDDENEDEGGDGDEDEGEEGQNDNDDDGRN